MGTRVTEVGDASKVKQLNPLSDPFWAQLNNIFSTAQGSMTTPEGMIGAAQGQAGNIEGLVGSLMGDYAGLQNSTAMLQAQENVRGVAGQYAQANAAGSGAQQSAVARGAALPFAQAATNIAGMQTQLGSGILDQFFGAYNQQNAGNIQLQLGAMGEMGKLAENEWWQPTYDVSNPWGDFFTGIAGGVAGAATGFLLGGPAGAVAGGAAGASGNFFGSGFPH